MRTSAPGGLGGSGHRGRDPAHAALDPSPRAGVTVHLADPVVHQHVGRARRHRPAPRADDRLRRERALDAFVLEPLVEEVRRAHREQTHGLVEIATAPLAEPSGGRRPLGEIAQVHVRRHDEQEILQQPRDAIEVAVELHVRGRVVLVEPRDRGGVALDVAPQRERGPVGERHEVVGRDDRDLVPEALQVELAHDLGRHQRHDVGRARDPVARPRLLGRRGAPDDPAFLQDEHIQAGLRKVRCAREAVVASPDDDDVAFEHAHGSGRVPGARCAAQRRTSRPTPGNRGAPRGRPHGVNSVQRRGLVNASVAAVATFAIGSAVVYADEWSRRRGHAPAVGEPIGLPHPLVHPDLGGRSERETGRGADHLLGVTAVTSAEAWAVGGIGEPELPTAVAIMRWDGDRWLPVAAPSAGTTLNELRAVDASEPNDVWAVGRTSSGFGEQPLVLHYDGTEWSDVQLPSEVDGVLDGVAALSPTDVWAVGSVGDPAASLERALVLHWDGTAWAEVEVGQAIGGGKAALVDVAGRHAHRPVGGGLPALQPADPPVRRRGMEPEPDRGPWDAACDRGVRHQPGVGGGHADPAVRRRDVDRGPDHPGRRRARRRRRDRRGRTSGRWARVRPRSRGRPAPPSTGTAADRWVPVEGPSVAGSEALSAVDALPDGTVFAVGWKDVDLQREALAIRGTTCPPEG